MSSGPVHNGLVGPGSRLDAGLIARYLQAGLWRNRPLGAYLDDAVCAVPDSTAAITVDSRGERVNALTYAELDDLSHG